MYAYCLFCDTVKCKDVVEQIERKLSFKAIDPKIIQRKWVKGVCEEQVRTLLPGYVFVYADAPVEYPRAAFRLDNVIRLLGEQESNFTLLGDDFTFARMLWNCGGTIGILKAYQEGDRVRLVPGALGGIEGEIVKLERRKGRAMVQYQVAGTTCTTWVGYDLIEGNDRVDLKE